jgi:hypothetical protein
MKAPKYSPDKEIVKLFEAAGVVEYLEYLQSGKRIMWVNFQAGVAKGLGLTVGLAVVLGIAVWVLTMLVDLPLVGEYFGDAQQYLTDYANSTNYEDEFAEMNQQLSEINENIVKLDDQPQLKSNTKPD